MCKLFIKYENEIKQYCSNNGLDFEKVKGMPQCWSKTDVWIQHFDSEKGKDGLRNETPAPIVLKISVKNGKVLIEQTEHTKSI